MQNSFIAIKSEITGASSSMSNPTIGLSYTSVMKEAIDNYVPKKLVRPSKFFSWFSREFEDCFAESLVWPIQEHVLENIIRKI